DRAAPRARARARPDRADAPTYEQLYAEARRRNIHGRSEMTKSELKRALASD
ncbi:plasmid stabilization protein, partial [Streptomyces sp. WAC06614]